MRAGISIAGLALALALALPAAPAAAQAAAPVWTRRAATEVQMRGVAATIRVTAEERPDIAVSITNPGSLPTPEVRLTRGKLVIDGGLERQIQGCRTRGGFEAQVRRFGWVTQAALPVIELRVPENAVVAAGGAIVLHAGPTRSLQLFLEGCGSADVERVDGHADFSLAGGDLALRAYDGGDVALRIAGGGDVTLGVVRNGLELSIAGAGDVEVARADGPTNIVVQGAGDVSIRDGRATVLSIAIMGAGDVSHGGQAETLDAAIFGGGDVSVARVTGEVSRRVFGGGEITVGD